MSNIPSEGFEPFVPTYFMRIKIQRDGKEVAYIILKYIHAEIEIEYLHTDPMYRGKGFATSLLNKAKAMSDRMKRPLIGFVDPDKSGGLTHEQEEKWLIKHGFIKIKKYDFGGYYKPVMMYNSQFYT